MDIRGGGGAGASDANSNGFIHTMMASVSVVGSSLFWFFTVSLAVAIHLVSRYISSTKNNDDKSRENKDDRIGEKSRGLTPEAEEEFIKKMRSYGDGLAGREAEAAAPSFSFKFQYQTPGIPRDTMMLPKETLVQEAKQEETLQQEAKEEEEDEEETPEVTEAAPIITSTHNYRFLTERDFRGFVNEPEAMTLLVQESYLQPEPEEPLHDQERRADAVFGTGGFLSVNDFRPVNEAEGCDESEMSEKDKPLERRKPSSSPSGASSGRREDVSGRRSFMSEEFSGFDDSDSESSLSDGYSVKELVVDSDSDWFLSEKDFSAAAAEDAVSLTRYKMKVLKGMQILEEAAKLQSFHDSATTESSDSMSEVTHDSTRDDSPKYSDDIWSGSNSPEVEFEEQEVREEEEEEVAKEAEETEEGNAEEERRRSLQIELVDTSDDEFYSSNKNSAPTYDVVVAKNSLEPSDDHSYEDVCDDKRSPEPSEREFASTNDHSNGVVSDAKKSLEPSEREFVSTNDHSNVVVSDAKNSSEPSEKEFVSASNHSDDATRQAEVSVAGKAKVEDEEEQDKWKDLTAEEEDELESLWEHQDLIEQLKIELKKVRAIGLPTILEESETPKAAMEDLKPWRIDAKFLREDPMDELNKFYKSYRERMRKFDILCYQKMYAIDFLQLRDPLHSTGSQKTLLPTVTSILSHNFRSSRRKSPDDPSEQFLKELRCDLETVYVGQMSLSWEFLRWQYEQARDLPESDPYRSHQYNQVAGEFQQFQVIVQRFIEDESFQGPRLPNYVNNRCVLRNLLQVPVIKEDSLKDRLEDQRKGNYVITSDELEDTMEESMRILWEFIKADKVEISVLKGLTSSHAELQEPSDYESMMHIHAILQKKEKKLKDLLRTGNCLVKKFKKPKEDRSNQDLFFSQVDMRLVSRVLKMTRITSDQLHWCRTKLNKITFVDRKIHREPSFLLFPC